MIGMVNNNKNNDHEKTKKQFHNEIASMAKIHFNDNDSVENFEIEKEKPHKCLNDIKFESTTESN